MQANEFSEPMAINSITFDAVTGTGGETTFYELFVDMGYCAGSELVTVYDTNYMSGSKIRVFETTSNITISAASPTIYFDTSFPYNPAEGNLIVDIIWPDGEGEFYSYNFPTAGVSSISGAYDLPEGFAFTDMSHLFLSDALSLEQLSFAGIKASFR